MVSFDFVESAAQSYRFIWNERQAVLRASLVVLAIKVVSFLAVVFLGFEDNVLRQGLMLAPAYFVEGWVIAKLMIMALLAADKKPQLPDVNLDRSIQAAAIMYLIIKLGLSFVMGMTVMGQDAMPDAAPAGPSLQTFTAAILMLMIMIWSFRFLWLYVPLSMGYSVTHYLKTFKSFGASFPMLGVWLLCFVPMALGLLVLSQVLGTVFPHEEGAEPVVYKHVMAFVQALIDYALSLASSIGMAYGIYSVFNNENKPTSIF